MTEPIKPGEVSRAPIPDNVIEVFNELIQKHWDGEKAQFSLNEAVEAVVKRFRGDGNQGVSVKVLLKNGWLDVEPVYRKVGWIVEYDKPGYNEDYPATFTFRKMAF